MGGGGERRGGGMCWGGGCFYFVHIYIYIKFRFIYNAVKQINKQRNRQDTN